MVKPQMLFKFNKELDRGASLLHISSSLLVSSSTFPSKEKWTQGKIRGIDFPEARKAQMVVYFANDTSFSIHREENYVSAMVDTLNQFSQASGLIINEIKPTSYY